jgi:uncharacterized membrane protein YoaK (UPF0700 family)
MIMTFVAGLMDVTTYLSVAKFTTTHLSTKILLIGVSATAGQVEAVTPYLVTALSFFLGAMCSGLATSTPKTKNLWTCAAMIMIVSLGYCLVALVFVVTEDDIYGRRLAGADPRTKEWYETAIVAPYLASFFSGMQNGLLTTITGFMRTTHMTGTVTDVGLLIGQAYPSKGLPWSKNHDHAHWWKIRWLSSLIGTWALGGGAGQVLFVRAQIGTKLGFIGGGIGIIVSLIGFYYLRKEAKAAAKVAAEEAVKAELKAQQAKLERQKTLTIRRQGSIVSAVTKVTTFRLNAGLQGEQ